MTTDSTETTESTGSPRNGSPKRSKTRLIALTIVAVIIVAATAVVVTTMQASDEVKVTAYFADAQPLRGGNQVKAAGVPVGTIDAVTLDHGRARVDMTLDRTVLPLHADASGRITQQDILGERYIALDKGTANAPLMAQPYVIQQDHTSRGTDLQEILNSVDTPTSTALAAMVSSLGEGVDGQGKNAAAAIAALEPAMTQTGQLADILGQQNQVLGQLVDRARPVADSLATDQGAKLDHLVGSTTDALGAVGDRDTDLRQTIQQLPGTLASARQTLAHVAGVADPATATLQGLRPTTDNLKDISGELNQFSQAADPALASLPPVLDRGKDLLDQLGPLAQSLRPAADDLRGAAPQARRISDQALDGRITNLMEFVKGWSLATSNYDAVSHYFKATVIATPRAAVQTGLGLLPGAPVDPLRNVNLLPGAPGATPGTGPNGTPAPGTASGAGGSAPAGSAPTDNNTTGPPGSQAAAGRPAPAGNSATGLRPAQEDSMMNQLLGGS
jgi:phospholipid/cholesterol/gamma-HCH transport system substrate-binding protein